MGECVDSIRSQLPPSNRIDPYLDELDAAIDSAFVISRELLGRDRSQAPGPPVADIHQVIMGLQERLGRILGPDIHLELRLAADNSLVQAEPAELEWILLNLAANSRDAMVNGGILSIETASLNRSKNGQEMAADDYIRVTVRDTGHGLLDGIESRMFQPFFTTRENAIGLGLTHVALTVRELRGWLDVWSEKGIGTTVNVQLPVLRFVETG
jgi:signal transduction histidine kinase